MFSPSRDEAQQEQLWEISINIVKDYLSPEVLERYGATLPTGAPSEQADQSGEHNGQSGEHNGQSSVPAERADQSGPPSEQADQSTTEGGSNAQDGQSEDTSGHGADENTEEQQHS